MALSNVLVLLGLVCVATGFPVSDSEIPDIPHPSRAQYFILDSDNTYKYGYDTGLSYETAVALDSGNVEGVFGFTDENGVPVSIQYTAGENGFLPVGNHLPVPVEVPVVDAVLEDQPLLKSAVEEGELVEVVPVEENAIAEPVPEEEPLFNTVPETIEVVVEAIPEESVIVNDLSEDGAYSFSYNTDVASRQEVADQNNNVEGSYTYVDETGHLVEVTYVAGASTGFVPQSDAIPVAPEVPDVPDVPAVPEVPEDPEVPAVQEDPQSDAIPVAPEAPEAPEVPEVPAVSEAPEASEAPAAVPEEPTLKSALEEGPTVLENDGNIVYRYGVNFGSDKSGYVYKDIQ